jgi:hypothetical protein
LVHAHMFADYLGTDMEQCRYDAAQSRYSAIFTEGRYNCISSTVLYIVLAKCFGLKVSGVAMPSHTFVQLETQQSPVEVENTSMHSGFDLVHYRAFYSTTKARELRRRGRWKTATASAYRLAGRVPSNRSVPP